MDEKIQSNVDKEHSEIPECVTYWLVPDSYYKRPLAHIVTGLAVEHNSVLFEPHVTVFAVSYDKRDSCSEIIHNAIQDIDPVILTVRGVEHSPIFTKTLYIQFEASQVLRIVSDRIRQASILTSDYILNPHLSLLYKTLDPDTLASVASQVTLPFGEVRFDTIKTVAVPPSITEDSDVEGWLDVAAADLGK